MTLRGTETVRETENEKENETGELSVSRDASQLLKYGLQSSINAADSDEVFCEFAYFLEKTY